MKSFFLMLILVVLAGCASQHDMPDTSNVQAWKAYGEKQANQGFVEYSKQDLEKKSGLMELNAAAADAYHQGYLIGQKQYCSQNPSWLASSGQTYRGICDEVNPQFGQNYMASSTQYNGSRM